MSAYIDSIYVNKISHLLKRFTKKSEFTWNFRCPLCGDSVTHTHRARGYIYKKGDMLRFHCHNCGESMPFGKFLKRIDPVTYNAYVFEIFGKKEDESEFVPDFEEQSTELRKHFAKLHINLPRISDLEETHIAKRICKDRRIPKKYFNEIYFASDFAEFVRELVPDYEEKHGKELVPNELRIVLPIYDEKNILAGIQGRAVHKSKAKYITILLRDDAKKIFGLNKVDFNRPIHVLEGAIDSFFLHNSIATLDAALYNVVGQIGSHDYIFIYDNEPRNHFIVKHMKRTISLGMKIFIWPKILKNYKDINECILAGYNPAELNYIVNQNTFTDLRAELEFTKWKTM